MPDWTDHLDAGEREELAAWKDHQEQKVLPAMESSRIVLSIAPSDGRPDAKFCVELGFAIMLGKPIIMIARRDAALPARLLAVADEVIRVDLDDPADARRAQALVAAAMERLGKDSNG